MALFDKDKTLQRHRPKGHESSSVTQLRIGNIGLRAFLWQRSVPETISAGCQCEMEWETPQHLELRCPELSRQRTAL